LSNESEIESVVSAAGYLGSDVIV